MRGGGPRIERQRLAEAEDRFVGTAQLALQVAQPAVDLGIGPQRQCCIEAFGRFARPL
jgi:hypothetical protein